ncbi:hypothetical protein D0Z00_002088 [Geotrichum galactomycetum]|uniref:Uncharacterized protein n=1 Tax=Geotrichum galactomycetum TaxID=27317 RepID=A0ACB6V530_9ASCO|nr:hypothetical protein D0Z00_002088 [Geotrichum candidum]
MTLLWTFTVDHEPGPNGVLTESPQFVFQTSVAKDAAIKSESGVTQDSASQQLAYYSGMTSYENNQKLELTATDGNTAYYSLIIPSVVRVYRVKNDNLDNDTSLNEEERGEKGWEQLVKEVLLGARSVSTLPIALTCRVNHERKQLILDVRKGYALRPGAETEIPIVGTFRLKERASETESRNTILGMLTESSTQLKSSLLEVNKLASNYESLQKQMTEFLQEKEASEAVLFEKFSVLLNKKKVKIRNLKRGIDQSDSDLSDIDSEGYLGINTAADADVDAALAAANVNKRGYDADEEPLEGDDEEPSEAETSSRAGSDNEAVNFLIDRDISDLERDQDSGAEMTE